mmetsp:Transcript_19263/g.54616  ORF Transcript_19263/g.54616 Transcript_19263/m.54616 type:complete len:211 (+) Transcript_19263:228-860(+)
MGYAAGFGCTDRSSCGRHACSGRSCSDARLTGGACGSAGGGRACCCARFRGTGHRRSRRCAAQCGQRPAARAAHRGRRAGRRARREAQRRAGGRARPRHRQGGRGARAALRGELVAVDAHDHVAPPRFRALLRSRPGHAAAKGGLTQQGRGRGCRSRRGRGGSEACRCPRRTSARAPLQAGLAGAVCCAAARGLVGGAACPPRGGRAQRT